MSGFKLTLPSPTELAATATRITRLVTGRPVVPVLHGALLTANEAGLWVEGFNTDTALSRLLEADVGEPATALVSAKLLANIAGTLPTAPVELIADDSHLRVRCGSVLARLPLMPVEDYPPRPELPELLGELEAEQLAAATTRVAHATGGDETLSGVHLHLTGQVARLCATDRWRLAATELAFSPALSPEEREPQWFRLEHAPLHEAAKAARGEQVRLAADDNLIGLVTARERVILRQLQVFNAAGIDRVLHGLRGQTTVITLGSLADAVKRARAYGPGAVVAADVGEHGLTLTTSSQDGDTVDTLELDYTGQPIRFGINPDYLAGAVAALDTEWAELTVPPAPNLPLQLAPLDDSGAAHRHVQLVVPKSLAGAV